ncbi:MAG: DUF2267 domain-containing protein [Anaerolineae bacterium]
MTDSDSLTGFYQQVKEMGKLPTTDHARRWSAAVLRTLGLTLDRSSKRQLARALAPELAAPLTRVFWLVHFRNRTQSVHEFLHQAAGRSGNTDPAFARYPTTAVFHGLKQLINNDLVEQIAESLSPELRQLWLQA